MDFYAQLPPWLDHLIRGLMICGYLCFSAVILTRMGRNPYWALLSVVPVPFLVPLAVWVLAYMTWKEPKPFKSRKKDAASA